MILHYKAKIYYINNNTKSISIPGNIIMSSGGYDPIHPGHVSYLTEVKTIALEESLLDNLIHVAVVNGDWFLSQKKGKPFMPLKDRCEIVSAIKGVDYVVGLDISNDMTVNKALKILKPKFFAKGGDRTDYSNIPEWNTCQKHNINILTKVGHNKKWSSSSYLEEWKKSNK